MVQRDNRTGWQDAGAHVTPVSRRVATFAVRADKARAAHPA